MKRQYLNKFHGITMFCAIISLGLVVFTSCLMGCKKFVQIPPPQTELVTTDVFNNNAGATSAMTNIYTQMFSDNDPAYVAIEFGLSGDELTNYYSTNTAYLQEYTNSLQAVTNAGYWNSAYKYIYEANAVIANLQTIVGCSRAVKQQLTGEAYFIRAFWHFYLTGFYGDVPLVLTPNYTINGTIARTSRLQVLLQIAKDLQTAQSMLNTNYIDGSDTIVTAARVRPNKATATAMLARAYLYIADYDNQNIDYYKKADSAASAVIGNGNYNLVPLNNVFLTGSQEAIWQIETPNPASFDDPDGYFFILTNKPGNSTTPVALSPQFMASFETGDQRESAWVGNYSPSSGVNYYFPFKYKTNRLNYDPSNITEYSTPLRLGEIYLIRAEARAREQNIGGSQSDLDMIRSRAGLGNTTAATTTDLLAAILHERRVELFAEWGHRWLDLCRTGNAPAVMGPPGNVCQAKGGSWAPDNHQLLFPIPEAEITVDVKLTQNTGY